MARKLPEIIAHIRACIADGSIKTTLIQTEDLDVLCNAADPGAPRPMPPLVEKALSPHVGWKVQSFDYYAAHFLVGSGLTQGDLYGNIRALSGELRKQYEIGVKHISDRMTPALSLGREAVVESFDHADTLDDKMLAEARLRDIDDALALALTPQVLVTQ